MPHWSPLYEGYQCYRYSPEEGPELCSGYAITVHDHTARESRRWKSASRVLVFD